MQTFVVFNFFFLSDAKTEKQPFYTKPVKKGELFISWVFGHFPKSVLPESSFRVKSKISHTVTVTPLPPPHTHTNAKRTKERENDETDF